MKKVLNHKEVYALIKAFGPKRTVIISGEFGVGKTALINEFRNDPDFANHRVLQPIECTQLSDGDLAMPYIDTELGVSRMLPNERFGVHARNQLGVNGSTPVVALFDEVGKIPQRIVNMIAAPLYEHRFGIYTMPEGSITFGCTNLTDEGLGDNLPAHILNRVCHVQMRKPTMLEWVNEFAVPRNLSPEILALVDSYPSVFDSYMDYQPGGKHEGKDIRKDNPWISNPHDATQEQVVTPRSLHAASDLVEASKRTGMSDNVLNAGLEGTVGASFAEQIMSNLRFGRNIPAYSRVLKDPKNCPMADSPVAQLIQVFQFVTNVKTRDEVEAVAVYTERMRSEMQTLLITRVANASSSLSLWCTNAKFGAALAENRKFLTP
jgi:hypothetical protein